MEGALVYLKLYLLASLIQFESGNGASTLRGTNLICYITPVPYGHTYQNTDIPYASKLTLETIIEVGIAKGITTHQRYLWQIASLEHIGGLLVQINHILQDAQLWARLHSLLYIGLWSSGNGLQFFFLFVNQHHLLINGQSAELAEQHARECQSVVDLHQRHLSLVDLHANAQSFRTGSNTLANHLLHIAIQLLNQVEIALSELLLMAQ